MGNGNSADVGHVNEVLNGHISDGVTVPSSDVAKRQLGFEDTMAWVRDDSFTNSPVSLVGRVFYRFEGDTELRSHIYSLDLEIDPASLLQKPLTRQEVVLKAETALNAGFLQFMSISIGAKQVAELRVIDNAAARARVVGKQWMAELSNWLTLNQKNEVFLPKQISYCAVVTGVVQKYISSKRFSEFEGNAKGGAYGVNVDGRLYLSSSEYALDIVYGVSVQDLTPFLKVVAQPDPLDKLLEAVSNGAPIHHVSVGGAPESAMAAEFVEFAAPQAFS